jgi:hypothetical protein
LIAEWTPKEWSDGEASAEPPIPLVPNDWAEIKARARLAPPA